VNLCGSVRAKSLASADDAPDETWHSERYKTKLDGGTRMGPDHRCVGILRAKIVEENVTSATAPPVVRRCSRMHGRGQPI